MTIGYEFDPSLAVSASDSPEEVSRKLKLLEEEDERNRKRAEDFLEKAKKEKAAILETMIGALSEDQQRKLRALFSWSLNNNLRTEDDVVRGIYYELDEKFKHEDPHRVA